MKITENLGEFQRFIEDDSKTGACLEDTLGFFDIQRIFGQFESVKQSGIRVTLIMTTLLVMLFFRNRNTHSYLSNPFTKRFIASGLPYIVVEYDLPNPGFAVGATKRRSNFAFHAFFKILMRQYFWICR